MAILKFEPSVDWKYLPARLNKAIEIGTPDAWQQRKADCDRQIRENPLLEEYVSERFSLELTMDKVRRHHRATGRLLDKAGRDQPFQRLYAFVSMLSEVYARLSAKEQWTIANRLRGDLKAPGGIESIAFEMHVASHLLARGFDVEWHDLDQGGGFDFLIVKQGLEAEVECKTFSGDLGRKIHKRRMYELGGLIFDRLADAYGRAGSSVVEVVVPDRLNAGDMGRIAGQLNGALDSLANFAGPEPCEVTIQPLEIGGSPFDCDDFPPVVDHDAVRDFVRDRYGHNNPQLLVRMFERRGVMLVILRSRRPDSVVASIYEHVKRGTKQFSGTRPAILCSHLLDMSAAQLRELDSAPKPSNLDFVAHRAMRSVDRKFLHSVTFSVHGSLRYRRVLDGLVVRNHRREVGSIYSIVSRDHILRDDPRLEIFL